MNIWPPAADYREFTKIFYIYRVGVREREERGDETKLCFSCSAGLSCFAGARVKEQAKASKPP